MISKSADRTRAAFVEELKSANNLITEAQAIEVYNVLDAVQALLAIPRGARIAVKKTNGTD